MAHDWYVLRVASGREEAVREGLLKKIQIAGLQDSIPTVLVPTERVSEIKGGKKRYREKKLYPGYIIVEMDLTDDVWYLIKETPGIGDFVGSFQKPIPLSPPEVEKILNTLKDKEETPEVKIDLEAGESKEARLSSVLASSESSSVSTMRSTPTSFSSPRRLISRTP